MKNIFILISLVLICFIQGCGEKRGFFEPSVSNSLRAPAYPLITIDPYTSAWSFTDNLYDDITRHWTGKKFPLLGVLRVDGTTYRFAGQSDMPLICIIPNASTQHWDAAFTETEPSGDWTTLNYNDTKWDKGKAAFGTPDMQNLSTVWTSRHIWVRRTFDLSEDLAGKPVYLEYSHDDDITIFINGQQVVETGFSNNQNVLLELSEDVKATLKTGKNIIAAHCRNRRGGGLVDFGLFLKDLSINTFETKAIQKSAQVLPTQTLYSFTCGPIELDVIFTSPLLLDNLELISKPVSYISWQVRASDGKPHDTEIYIETTPHWAVNTTSQDVVTDVFSNDNYSFVKTGTTEQSILKTKGDDVRIDWGYFYLAAKKTPSSKICTGEYKTLRNDFINGGFTAIKTTSDKTSGFSAALIYTENIGKVSTSESGYLMIGYDDIYSIQYFHDNRPAYWKHNGKVDITQAFESADKNYNKVMNKCASFNADLIADATKAGGKEYAELCALAYRQSVSAHKLVEDKDGNLLFLSKENFSNGSIGTVDITYPSAPLYLCYNPELLKGMLNPVFYFSESGKWNKPFPAHDVGTYPLANGQTYGGDMPVEEAGNMLILTTAIAMVEGNASYAKKHWNVLTTWANYLLQEGLDPENQLCTDDFAGHFAHNANLSIKAILGIAGYGKLAKMSGDKTTADKYISAAKKMAQQWIEMDDDGDHYRLTFDKSDTWSQKYNLVWDKLFGLNIFPDIVAKKEVPYYLSKQNIYGLPLDSRKDYTKSDWIVWSACLADNNADFQKLILPLWKYANETQSRIPLSDWHDTKTGSSVGFRARSVVGAYFMKILEKKKPFN